MIKELLERAVKFFRLAQHAYGSVSWQAYLVHPDRKSDAGIEEVTVEFRKGNYLRVADIIETGILPLFP